MPERIPLDRSRITPLNVSPEEMENQRTRPTRPAASSSTADDCATCGRPHPVIEGLPRWSRSEPGREGILSMPGHVPCPTCNNYHPMNDDHVPCGTCGQIHPDTRPNVPATNGDFVENPEHGPLRHCEGCDEFVHPDHADNWEEHHYGNEADAMGWYGGREPRDEQTLEDQEPERVAGIRGRIDKMLKMHDSRVADSPYFIKHSPRGTYYGQYSNNVQVYHKSNPNTRVGVLTYDDEGIVGQMYLDHRHQNTMAGVQMLAAAHRHLKNTLGNPIGLLRTESTSEQSAGLIRKIDPDSTYLRNENANSGRNEGWQDNQSPTDATPVRNDSLNKPVKEWEQKAKESGRSVADLLAMSYDPEARRSGGGYQFNNPSPEAKAIGAQIAAGQKEEYAASEKANKEFMADSAKNILAAGVHHVAGDMPESDALKNPWKWDAYHDISQTRSVEELKKTYPDEVVREFGGYSLSHLADTVKANKPTNHWNRKYSEEVSEVGRKNFFETNMNNVADTVGTSGVWTGDEETDEKATLPAPKPKLPLDLNPYERVKRIVTPTKRVLYVRDGE